MAALHLADVVDGADIRMIQRRCRPGFAAEALECREISRHVVGQELQGNKAAEKRVLGLVHDAHPALAESLDDAVARDGCADHECGEGG